MSDELQFSATGTVTLTTGNFVGNWFPQANTEAVNATVVGGTANANQILVSTDTGHIHVLDAATPGGFRHEPVVVRNYTASVGGSVTLPDLVYADITIVVTDNRATSPASSAFNITLPLGTSSTPIGQRYRIVFVPKNAIKLTTQSQTSFGTAGGSIVPSTQSLDILGAPFYFEYVFCGDFAGVGPLWRIVSTTLSNTQLVDWSNNGA